MAKCGGGKDFTRRPKNSPCHVGQITFTNLPRFTPDQRGALRGRHETLGGKCGGRVGAQRRSASTRTAKSCGPGIPTLMSSLRDDDVAGEGGNKARSPGRARKKP